jgi:hypothetical protein
MGRTVDTASRLLKLLSVLAAERRWYLVAYVGALGGGLTRATGGSAARP